MTRKGAAARRAQIARSPSANIPAGRGREGVRGEGSWARMPGSVLQRGQADICAQRRIEAPGTGSGE